MTKGSTFECFVDLEGKIPAQPGDRVALVVSHCPTYPTLVQEIIHLRPTLMGDGGIHFEGWDNGPSEFLASKTA